MNELTHANAHAFQRRFRLKGGRLLRFRIKTRSDGWASAAIRLTAFDAQSGKPIRLQLRFANVEEYRFQRRPSSVKHRLGDVQFGFFGDLIYLNLDAFTDDGPPKVMDFRASDWFIAGRTVHWQVVEKKPAT